MTPSLAPHVPRGLEDWVRLRLAWFADDPWTAAIGAAGRLMGAGMDADEAVATVARMTAERYAPSGIEMAFSVSQHPARRRRRRAHRP